MSATAYSVSDGSRSKALGNNRQSFGWWKQRRSLRWQRCHTFYVLRCHFKWIVYIPCTGEMTACASTRTIEWITHNTMYPYVYIYIGISRRMSIICHRNRPWDHTVCLWHGSQWATAKAFSISISFIHPNYRWPPPAARATRTRNTHTCTWWKAILYVCMVYAYTVNTNRKLFPLPTERNTKTTHIQYSNASIIPCSMAREHGYIAGRL